MKKWFVFAVALAICSAASAQQYKWVDKDGKVQYGDVPPPGVNATQLKGPRSAPEAPAAKADAKDASKGPLTPAEQEAEYRKRQVEAQKGREKEEKSAQDAKAKRENCANSQEQLRVLESGQRYSRTDAKGERYYLDDDQRAAEIAKARKLVGDWCS